MTILHVPVTFANIAEWVRRAGGAINQLITGKLDLSGGTLTGDLIVPDEAYGVGWDGSLEVPTKNALYDKIETISGGGVSDGDKGDIVVSSSGAVWEFDTGVVTAFAKTFLDDADAAAVRTTLSAAAASHTHAQADVTGLTTADSPQFAGINLGHASDTTLTRVSAGVVAVEGVNIVTTAGGVTFAADISVPDEAYDATNWNGSVEVPTKNAIRDKIESMALPGSGTSFPGSPASGDRFWRSDRNLEYVYDGTRWLTAQLFSLPFTTVLGAAADQIVYLAIPYVGTYSMYIERFDTSTFRTAAGEWDVLLQWVSATNVLTTIATIDGNGNTTSNWVDEGASVGSVLDANAKALVVTYDEVSGTATLFGSGVISYRLVG